MKRIATDLPGSDSAPMLPAQGLEVPSQASLNDWVTAYAISGMPTFVRPPAAAAYANCANCQDTSDEHRLTCECLICHGYWAATTDVDRGLNMLRRYPRSVLGVATGHKLHRRIDERGYLVVIDCDPRNGGETWLAQMFAQGIDMTLCATTKRGGLHVFFHSPTALPTSTGRIAPGIDIEAVKGNVKVPPAEGRRWMLTCVRGNDPRWCKCPVCVEWREGEPMSALEWLSAPLAPLPQAIGSAIAPNQSSAHFRQPVGGLGLRAASLTVLTTKVRNASEGTRHRQLYIAAATLGEAIAVGRHRPTDSDLADLIDAAVANGLPVAEARSTAGDGYRRGLSNTHRFGSNRGTP